VPGTIDNSGLSLRSDYFGDPLAWRAFCDLLMDIFGIDVTPLEILGGPDPTTMATGYFDADGRCIANLSAFSMPLMIEGEVVRAAGWQSGAVRPAWRGRGLFRKLMDITFERCIAAGYEAMMLTTRHPGLYEPYGFQPMPQAHFAGPAPAIAERVPRARRLDIRTPEDLDLIRSRLLQRAPVSSHFSVVDQSHMFLLNAWLSGTSLHWLEQFHCITASGPSASGGLALLDVVGDTIPTLATILAAIAPAAQHVAVHFPTDRLDWQGQAVPDDSGMALMMWSRDGRRPGAPVQLSPMADF
jgi:GNAT superfamily N-acetyltransferase